MKPNENPASPSATPAGSASGSNHEWRRYRLTHVTAAWQQKCGKKWRNFSKTMPHSDFMAFYEAEPPRGIERT